VTADTGPPDRRRGPVTQPAPSNVEVATTDTAAVMVDDRSDVIIRPRWTGCPAGCPPDHHECGVGEPVVEHCGACGALSVAERESLITCWSVCPMRAGEAL
jgi:hypothetical protein